MIAKRRHRNRFLSLLMRLAGVALLLSVSAVLALRWYPPPTTAFMIRAQFLVADGLPQDHYRWADWEQISPYLKLAVIAAEDQKFLHHWGIDLEQTRNALRENKHRRRPRGASTITQQVAKNLFLWPGRSYLRKGLEAYFALLIELLWSKRRILEVYVNVAEFAPGTYGAEAASNKYFAKPAREIDAEEAALLAAVLPNPRQLTLERPSPYVRGRARWIRTHMDRLGGIRLLDDPGFRA